MPVVRPTIDELIRALDTIDQNLKNKDFANVIAVKNALDVIGRSTTAFDNNVNDGIDELDQALANLHKYKDHPNRTKELTAAGEALHTLYKSCENYKSQRKPIIHSNINRAPNSNIPARSISSDSSVTFSSQGSYASAAGKKVVSTAKAAKNTLGKMLPKRNNNPRNKS